MGMNHRARARRLVAGLAAVGLLFGLVVEGSASASSTARATTDRSPVNLSTKIDMAAGTAQRRATVVEGDARFEVLSPEVIRLEYSPDGHFVNDPTFDILDRDFSVPRYTTSVSGGWLTITTSAEVLRYQLGSGPFDPTNTSLRLLHAPQSESTLVAPGWEWECTFGQACQSGAATLADGASLASNHSGYDSPPGFVANYNTGSGATATWNVLNAPAGAATVAVRYSNYLGASGQVAPQTMSVVVNGTPTTVTLQPTTSWDDWSTYNVPVTLKAGTNSVAVSCATGDTCDVNVDDIAVSAVDSVAAPFLPADPLGGYIRSFDSANGTYSAAATCAAGESNTTCQAPIPAMASGLLDRSGWYLLDDSQTAVWTKSGWIAPRPSGDVEDGYLFGYGDDYKSALEELKALTGPSPLLPEYVFGNWFSRYYPYTTSEYEDQLLPAFKANHVSLDTLSVDTDWKSPNEWDGWEWNSSLFPDPTAFLKWAHAHDIHVTLNIHSSISTSDPQYAEAQALAGGKLAVDTGCSSGTSCAVWDWSTVNQAESNFAVQNTVGKDGVDFWWLDWCCDLSDVSMAGVTPDAWVNHLYAQEMVNSGERGFVLARIGASLQDSVAGSYPSGPWADHRSALAFTGDTSSTWNTLAEEAQLAQDEASIGEPYVSDDIGGFLGPPAGTPNDPDDLYLRWLQLGTFQPIMREHSNAGQNARLPWDYDAATATEGDQFLQLREELVPYLYTLADDATVSGLPMTQALYLDYPGWNAAYEHPTEYLLGSHVLVAPVTSPGQVASESVWFPPGRWVDWFTGATVQGPTTQTIQVPLSRMPVFVKAGSIVPLQPSSGHAQTAGTAPLTLRVAAGGNGSFTLYDDSGTGLGYEHGQDTHTTLTYTQSGGAHSTSTVVINPSRGSYSGAPDRRRWSIEMTDISAPKAVSVDGAKLASSQWSYDAATDTLIVPVGDRPTDVTTTVTQTGGTPLSQAEPAATSLTIDPSSNVVSTAGTPTTVSTTLANSGPGTITSAQLQLEGLPSGWTATPTTATTAASVAAGSSLMASWTVTPPSSPAGATESADLTAQASYVDPATGRTTQLTTAEIPSPSISSVAPTTASAGQVVTVTGLNFGATQGSSYLEFSDDGTNWGAPGDLATFDIDSWSNGSITFTVPEPSGSGGTYHVTPGTTATVTVTDAQGQASNTADVTIGSS